MDGEENKMIEIHFVLEKITRVSEVDGRKSGLNVILMQEEDINRLLDVNL